MGSFLQQLFVFLALAQSVVCQLSTTWAASRFIGYYVAPGSVEPLLAGTSWGTISSLFAGDCDSSGNCQIVTECANGTAFYDNGNMQRCTGGFTCATMTIFATSPNILPSAYNYGCRTGWKANTVYRELSASTTSSSSVATSTPTSALIISAPTPLNTNPAQTSTPPVTPNPSPSPSKAWIAGAVIVPLVGVALILAAVLWWRRKSQANHAQPYELGNENPYGTVKYAYEKDSEVRPVELPSTQAPREMYHEPHP